jgi:serine/threonine protein kinase
LTPASDLYSAGIVVYEMLTGTVPFTGDSAIAIAMQHMNEDVPAPSKLNPSVTPHLDAIVARATAKEPGARYQSARDMAEALANWERREPTLVAGAAAQPSSTQSLQPAAVGRYTPRGVTRAALLSLAGLVLLAGSVLAFRVLTDSGEEPSAASNRSSGGAAQRGEPTPNDPAEEAEAETSPTSTEPTDGILISEDIIGARSKDVEKLLEGEGVIVESIDQDSEEEKDTVLGVEPPSGTTVAEGDTVTLTVSTGKAAEEEDDEDDD